MQRVMMLKSTQINFCRNDLNNNGCLGRQGKCSSTEMCCNAIESTADSTAVFNYFNHNCSLFGNVFVQITTKSYFIHNIIQVSKCSFSHAFFFASVSLRPEIKSDWSERTVFDRKFVPYDDRSSDGRRTLVGHPMCGDQPWDSRWPVMGQQLVFGRNNKYPQHTHTSSSPNLTI